MCVGTWIFEAWKSVLYIHSDHLAFFNMYTQRVSLKWNSTYVSYFLYIFLFVFFVVYISPFLRLDHYRKFQVPLLVVVLRNQNEDTQTREVGWNKYITITEQIYRMNVLPVLSDSLEVTVFIACPTDWTRVAQGLFRWVQA